MPFVNTTFKIQDSEPWSEPGIVEHGISPLDPDTGWLLMNPKTASASFLSEAFSVVLKTAMLLLALVFSPL